MKINNQKGFVTPLIIVIMTILAIGSGVYVYENKKTETPAVIDIETQQTNTPTLPVNTNQSVTNTIPYSDLNSADKKLIVDLVKDTAVKNNVNGLRDFITQYYKTESNPCTNKYVIDYINSSTVGHIICKSNSTSYAGSSVLVSTPTASWCADSSGFIGQGIIIYQTNKYSCSPTNIAIPVMPKFVKPSITILSPNGGENFVVDGGDINASIPVNFTLNKPQGFSVYLINSKESVVASWATDNRFNSDLKINYKFNVNSLISGEKNSSPTKAGEYKIKVCDYDGNNCDTSDNYFTIIDNRKSSIKVLSPNGGEKLLIGNKYEVKWSTSNNSDFVRLFLMPGNIPITSMANAAAEFSSPFSWTINTNILPGQYKVEARLYTPYGDVPSQISFDQSDDYFTVTNSK